MKPDMLRLDESVAEWILHLDQRKHQEQQGTTEMTTHLVQPHCVCVCVCVRCSFPCRRTLAPPPIRQLCTAVYSSTHSPAHCYAPTTRMYFTQHYSQQLHHCPVSYGPPRQPSFSHREVLSRLSNSNAGLACV
mmetsp:Transcript_23892/g.68719  ORF Transcript_23892/g.68719 Transcript_23892/m.68719 type:complete len:133 (-) Transcript_23892:280-678(-)